MKVKLFFAMILASGLYLSGFVSAEEVYKPKTLTGALLVRMDSIAFALGAFEPETEMVNDGSLTVYHFVANSQGKHVIKGVPQWATNEAMIIVYKMVRFAFPGDASLKNLNEGEIYDIHLKMVLKEDSKEEIFHNDDGLFSFKKVK